MRWSVSLALSSLLCSAVYVNGNSYTTLQNSWKLIKLKEAYGENPSINGEGIIVGVVDGQFNPEHPSLKGKVKGVFNNNYDFINAQTAGLISSVQHGTHVAGIILGEKLADNQPHGIAYKGSFYGVAFLNSSVPYRGSLYNDLADKNLKIVNNSWGIVGMFPLINRHFNRIDYTSMLRKDDFASIPAREYFNLLDHPNLSDAASLVRLSREKGILNILASGNDGSITSSFLGAAAAYDESLRSWLVVGALDADNITESNGNITINAKAVTISSQRVYRSGVAYFSNLFHGTALYGIVAPGMNIQSANAIYQSKDPNLSVADKTKFITMSGTSQATPMVSGAAALIQQKFGFLNGAQIADVLLSTASYENVTLPRIIVQNYYDDRFKYNVIYIGENPPTTSGNIDRQKVRVDLRGVGYSDSEINEIFANLYKPNNRPNSDAILRLEKYEVIGQGILNIQKALKGLARLDANRLNLKDILSFEGQKQAFYTIDTQGMNAEFGNSIAQRDWDSKWHISDAYNSPADEMRGITKVGLIKKGEGILSLSGSTNSYKGATRILEGTLEIKSGSSLTESNVYTEGSGSTFSLSGEIAKNLRVQDRGLAFLNTGSKVGGSSVVEQEGKIKVLNSATIVKALTAQHQGVIELGNSAVNSPPNLKAGSVYLKNGGVLSGAGTITPTGNFNPRVSLGAMRATLGVEKGLYNESGVVMAGFNQVEEAINLAHNKLTIKGIYDHGKEAILQIAFSGDRQNSQLIADNYAIQGGTLAFVSIYDGAGTLLRPNQVIQLELEGLKDHTTKFTTIQAQNNLLTFVYAHENETLSSILKNEALRPVSKGDLEVGKALRDIYSKSALSKQYKDYFGKVAQADYKLYQNSVDSLAPNASLLVAKDALKATNQVLLNHLISSLDFYTQYVSLSRESKDQIFVDGNYAFSAYSHTMGTSMQYQHSGNAGVLGVFANYHKSKAKYNFAKTDSDRFMGGVSGVYDLSLVSLLLSASGGIGLNHTYRSILDENGLSKGALGENKSYLFSIQLGLQKDLMLSSFVFRPMALLDYLGIFQEAYQERGELFAKSYDQGINHKLSALFGASMGYKMKFGQAGLFMNVFGFYQFGALRTLSNQSRFNDFSPSFKQNLELNEHSFQGGVNLEFFYKSFFTRLGLGSEAGSKDYWLNTSLALGLNF